MSNNDRYDFYAGIVFQVVRCFGFVYARNYNIQLDNIALKLYKLFKNI